MTNLLPAKWHFLFTDGGPATAKTPFMAVWEVFASDYRP
jgi:hypothetical protein